MNVKTRRTISDNEAVDKTGKRLPDGTELMVGERMKIVVKVSTVVAYELNEKRARQDYMEALIRLPNGYTKERSIKKTMLNWARSGVSSEDIVDRVKTLMTIEELDKEEHERLLEEHLEFKRRSKVLGGNSSRARILEDILETI